MMLEIAVLATLLINIVLMIVLLLDGTKQNKPFWLNWIDKDGGIERIKIPVETKHCDRFDLINILLLQEKEFVETNDEDVDGYMILCAYRDYLNKYFDLRVGVNADD